MTIAQERPKKSNCSDKGELRPQAPRAPAAARRAALDFIALR